MPGLNIYVDDDIYKFLLDQGKPTTIGKKWIEERYKKETEK